MCRFQWYLEVIQVLVYYNIRRYLTQENKLVANMKNKSLKAAKVEFNHVYGHSLIVIAGF